MSVILGIESTCDETAAAVVVDGFLVRTNVIASQVDLHAKYRGVVPEIASRAHIENILPVLREGMGTNPKREEQKGTAGEEKGTAGESEKKIAEEGAPQLTDVNSSINLDAIGVAYRPGLIGCLLVGVTAAKTLAWAIGKPLIGVDHVHAHLYSVVLETNHQPRFPAVGLVVSGGHTALYRVGSWLDVELIGSTIDDAVGEAYDKVAAILDVGFPGGPALDKLAQTGDPRAVKLPRTFLGRDSLDFSFSGLKTAVLYHVRGVPSRRSPLSATPTRELSPQDLADIAASFQAACIDVILEKLRRAAAQIGAKSIIIGGGVSANRGLRAALGTFDLPVHVPLPAYCTDNAAMTAGLAHVLLDANQTSPLELDAIPFSQFRR